MGRPKGSKDLKPRKRPGQTVTVEDNEFMPPVGTLTTAEPAPESLQAFAASILNDDAYRQSLRDRSKTGKLTTSESRLLVELGMVEAAKAKPKGNQWGEYATKDEIRTLARISACVIGRRDGKQRADDPARRCVAVNLVGDEIVTWR